MNGNNILEHLEKNYQRITEEFIEKNKEDFDSFVEEDYNNSRAV